MPAGDNSKNWAIAALVIAVLAGLTAIIAIIVAITIAFTNTGSTGPAGPTGATGGRGNTGAQGNPGSNKYNTVVTLPQTPTGNILNIQYNSGSIYYYNYNVTQNVAISAPIFARVGDVMTLVLDNPGNFTVFGNSTDPNIVLNSGNSINITTNTSVIFIVTAVTSGVYTIDSLEYSLNQ